MTAGTTWSADSDFGARKIPIAFLIRSLNRGGAERQLADLARGLGRHGFDVTVLTFYPAGPIWDELAQCSGVRLESLSKNGRWDVWRFSRRLSRSLRRLKPMILHCYMTEPAIFGLVVGRLSGVPAVVWGVRVSNMDYSKYGRLNALSSWIAARLSSFADLIIANSEAGRVHHVRRGYSARHFLTVPNGIDTNWFLPSESVRAAARSEWSISDDEVLVGVAARLDPMKGHDTLLAAAVRAVRRLSSIRFVCVGAGPRDYTAKLRVLASSLGLGDRVIWAGEKCDMRMIYPAFDIACSSSAFGEGFSNSVGEAMSCGVPCVVTDVGDSAAIVGDAGYVVGPADPAALGDAIVRMATLPRHARTALGLEGRRRIANRFSLPAMIDQTVACYRDL